MLQVGSREDVAERDDPAIEKAPPQDMGGGCGGRSGSGGRGGLSLGDGGSVGAGPQEVPVTEKRALPPHAELPKQPERILTLRRFAEAARSGGGDAKAHALLAH